MALSGKVFGLGALLTFRSNRAVAEMNKAQVATDRMVGGFTKAGATIKGTVSSLAGLGAKIGLVGGVGVGFAVKKAAEWESGMSRIATLLDEQGMRLLPQISTDLSDLQKKYGIAGDSMRDAAFQAISASVPFTKLRGFMEVAGKTAVAGFTDMRTAVDGLTNVLNAYGMDVDEALRVSDAFFVANKLGKTTIGELSQSLGQITPLASILKIDFRELAASVAGIAIQGINTSEAVTGLRAALSNIIRVTPKAVKEAERLGIEFGPEAMQKAGGLIPFFQQLMKATDGNVQSLGRFFRSADAMKVVLASTSAKGAGVYAQAMAEMREQTSLTETSFAKVADDAKFQMARVAATWSGFVTSIGKPFLPLLAHMAEVGAKAGQWVEANRVRLQAGLERASRGLMAAFDWLGPKMEWLVRNGDTLLALAKQYLVTWLQVKAVVAGVALYQGVTGAVATGRMVAAGGLGKVLMDLRETGKAVGTVAPAATAAAAGLAATGAAGKSTAAAVGAVGAQVARAGLNFATAFYAAAAGMVGWNIGKWLVSLGADELVFRLLRANFGANVESLAEARTAAKQQDVRVLREQRWGRLAAVSGQLGYGWVPSQEARTRRWKEQVTNAFGVPVKGSFKWLSETKTPGQWAEANKVGAAKITAEVAETIRRMASGLTTPAFNASPLVRNIVNNIQTGTARDIEAFARDVAKGAYGETGGLTDTMIDRVFRRAAKAEEKKPEPPVVNVTVPPPTVEIDGRSLAKGLGQVAARENTRGVGEGRLYSPAERQRIMRAGVGLVPAAVVGG